MPRAFAFCHVLTAAFCALLALQGSVMPPMGCAMATREATCRCHDVERDTHDDAAPRLRTGPCCCSAAASQRQQANIVAPPETFLRDGVGEVLELPVTYQLLPPAPWGTAVAPVASTAAGPPIRLQTCAFLI